MAERVLVVDDEKSIRTIVEYALKDGGFEVVSASRGDDALDILEREAIDLVVLDLMLPGIDGMEVCRRIRAHRNVPIIMLSARGDEVDKVLGLEMGADDYVTKPFSPRELVSRGARSPSAWATCRSTQQRARAPAMASRSTSPTPSSRSCSSCSSHPAACLPARS